MSDKRLWFVGSLVIAVAVLALLTVPSSAVADQHEKAEMGPTNNHFKCYQILDWAEFQPQKYELKDQFGKSVARTMEPFQVCNPVDKNGEGIADKEYHLVCYRIQDDPVGPYERVKEVMTRDQSYEGPLWVGSAGILCMPAMKHYDPRG